MQHFGPSLVITALLLLQFGAAPGAAQTPQTPLIDGIAGHYAGPMDMDPNHPKGTPVSGSCGYGVVMSQTWPGFNSASISINSSLFSDPGAPLSGCGRCIEVQCKAPNCPPGAVPLIAQVQDQCTSCPPTQFNLPYIVWAASLSMDTNLGMVPVSYRRVDCNPPGTITVNLQELRVNLGGYIKLALDSVKGSGVISGVGIRQAAPLGGDSAAFLPLKNTGGAVWEASNILPPPYDFQFIGPHATLDARNVVPAGATPQTYPTNVQFP